jgi:purine-binding chemotaxis protein CheW
MLLPIVIFEVGTYRYGIPLGDTREVLRATSIVPLPQAPAIIEGIVNVRGTVVPVLDIRKRFRLPPKALHPADRFVLAYANSRTVALRVDQVIGISQIAAGDIEDAKAIAPRAEYVAGVAKLSDGLVLLHDLGTFLSEAESQQINAAVEEISP